MHLLCLFHHRIDSLVTTHLSLRVFNEEAELSYLALLDYFMTSHKTYQTSQVLVNGQQSQALVHKEDSLE